MNNPYSILVLRGTQVHRFVVSKKGLRQLLLAGITVVFAGGVFLATILRRQKENAMVLAKVKRKRKSRMFDSGQGSRKRSLTGRLAR